MRERVRVDIHVLPGQFLSHRARLCVSCGRYARICKAVSTDSAMMRDRVGTGVCTVTIRRWKIYVNMSHVYGAEFAGA